MVWIPAACGVAPGGVTADPGASFGVGTLGTGGTGCAGGTAGGDVVVPGIGELPGGICGTAPLPS